MAETPEPSAVPADTPVPADAPYQSLYRRYRPQRFEDVRGQEHVTRALRNAVRDGKVAHAYLFSGPRGTGKTSTARILAMALNCEHPVGGEPDGTCPSCVEIRRGASLDVHELDAASNRKLDEMRDLLSRVALGTRGRWKVYIVDEVHQLTADAASALLKTLEEPPGHVVFVLATTDPQKVLPTIRSRTQHYEFKLLGADVLGQLLNDVNKRAALGLPPEAIDLVVRRGHGSARDALSVLDQVAAAGDVEDEASVVSGIVEALASHDPGRVLMSVAEAMTEGRDPRRLASDLVEHLRNGFLAIHARNLVLLPDDAVAEVEEQARHIGMAGVVKALEVLGQAGVDMRDAVDPRVTLEAALVRLAAPQLDAGSSELVQRIERLEGLVAQLSAGSAGAQAAVAPPAEVPVAVATPADRPTPRPASPPPPAAVRPPAGLARSGDQARPPAGADRGVGAPPPMPGRGSRPDTGPRPGQAPPGAPRPASPRPALGAHRRGPGSGASPPAVAVRPAPAGGGGLAPSRDELTKAWGDHVLPGLQPRLKAFVAAGRFVASEDGTPTYAVADPGLLARAQPLQPEIEAAISAHFGRPVRIKLVVDGEAAPALPNAVPSEPDDDEVWEIDDLRDAGPAVTSPEQRLLEAFPGAEEVTP